MNWFNKILAWLGAKEDVADDCPDYPPPPPAIGFLGPYTLEGVERMVDRLDVNIERAQLARLSGTPLINSTPVGLTGGPIAMLPVDPPAIRAEETRCTRILPNGQTRHFRADRVVAESGPEDIDNYGVDPETPIVLYRWKCPKCTRVLTTPCAEGVVCAYCSDWQSVEGVVRMRMTEVTYPDMEAEYEKQEMQRAQDVVQGRVASNPTPVAKRTQCGKPLASSVIKPVEPGQINKSLFE